MAEGKASKAELRAIRGHEAPSVNGMVAVSGDYAERVVTTAFDLVRDVRGELSRRGVGILDFAESTQAGLLKLSRDLFSGVDRLSQDTLDVVESLTLSSVRIVRGTSEAAAEVATKTVLTFAGAKREANPKAA